MAHGVRQRGFTLLEVVVAFALLALALTFLLGALSGGIKQVRNAEDAGRATLHAQSLLSQLGVGEKLEPGQRDGRFEGGRYRWTLQIAPYVDPQVPRAPETVAAPKLVQVRLQVAWGETAGQRLEWHTLRLVPTRLDDRVLVP